MSRDLLDRFRGCQVLVVGDLMLDEFIWGQVSRISPEAPVPVVEVKNHTFVAGGAANTAANVAALGGESILAGLIGNDSAGERMLQLLKAAKVDCDAVVSDASRPTITKTRVVAHSQQMVRIDRETPGPVTEAIADELIRRISSAIPKVRACVISDYGKGVVAPRVAQDLINLCRSRGVPVVVDPKGTDYRKYCGATLVKPNLAEAAKVLNRDLSDEAAVRAAGRDLLESLGKGSAVLITRGAQGMDLFEQVNPDSHIPAMAREVFDVTGAGDTVAGTIALALAAGGTLEAACRLAAAAAAIVVGKIGTATVSLAELEASITVRQAA